MKIFAIINNYSAGIFGGADMEPDWYEMPDSAVLRNGNPFFVPDFSGEFSAFPSVVYRIGRLGKTIAPRFAPRYTEAMTMGVAVIATDLLARLRAAGQPWTRAVAFDRSCILGDFVSPEDFHRYDSFDVRLGDERITYRPADLKLPFATILSRISSDNTIKNGDLILAGLPGHGLPLAPGTRLTAAPGITTGNEQETNEQSLLLDINIR